MDHDAPPSAITPKATARASAPEPTAAQPKAAGGLWPFLRTLFIGSAGLAVLAVIATLAGSAWLTANQRAEAEKPQPWADPSFTTTAVTTGGMLARFMDNDGNLDNGHSYITGIYNLWKARQEQIGTASLWAVTANDSEKLARLPPLWAIEFATDAVIAKSVTDKQKEQWLAEQRKEMLERRMNRFSR